MVTSILDLDFYKITMLYYAYTYYSDTVVEYKMVNRSRGKYRILDYVSNEAIQTELDKCKRLHFTKSDIDYLRTLNRFSEEFLTYLSSYTLFNDGVSMHVEESDGDVSVIVSGKWIDTILWETIVLSTINELYYIHKYNYDYTDVVSVALERLRVKMDKLSKYNDIAYMEFGTRRRFSSQLQYDLLANRHLCRGTLVGTSNVKLAKEFGIKPLGTNAHELYMIMSGIYSDSDESIRNSHGLTIQKWYDLYGYDLSVALSDTYGTDFFLSDFGKYANLYKGIRQDSGSPYEFADKIIAFYNEKSINALDKVIVFSDGLDVDKIIDLYEKYNNQIQTMFGWGTNYTNDVGYETLSLVMKAVRVISVGDKKVDFELVKLSDNINKATGSKESVDRYKRIFGYTNTNSEELTY